MTPTLKAWAVSLGFAVVGLLSAMLLAPQNAFLAPHVAFYATLTLNSFFSIRLFSSIQPRSFSQGIADAGLVVTYVGLAFSIGYPLLFAFFALGVFIAAPPKYALMLGVIPHPRLLKRKILIDIAGTALCALVLAGTLLGYELESAWILASVFALANLYLLLVRPMYTLD